jgi:hypothetical protein
VSAFSDAVGAVRNVILMQSKLERLEAEISALSGDLRGLKDYTVTLDRRIARVEGFVEGAAAASKSRLPRE